MLFLAFVEIYLLRSDLVIWLVVSTEVFKETSTRTLNVQFMMSFKVLRKTDGLGQRANWFGHWLDERAVLILLEVLVVEGLSNETSPDSHICVDNTDNDKFFWVCRLVFEKDRKRQGDREKDEMQNDMHKKKIYCWGKKILTNWP